MTRKDSESRIRMVLADPFSDPKLAPFLPLFHPIRELGRLAAMRLQLAFKGNAGAGLLEIELILGCTYDLRNPRGIF